jgi:hypothetical protein
MKKMVICTVFFLVCGAVVFSYDKGALAVNVEAPVTLFVSAIKLKGFPDGGGLGFDGGIQATANYYFFRWLSVNAGLGFGWMTEDYGHDEGNDHFGVTNSALYFSVPFGFRLNARAFVAGAGLIAHFPFNSTSYRGIRNRFYGETTPDDSFAFNPFVSGYIDLGFDLSGRDERTHGFGMLLRLAFAFSEKTGGSDGKIVAYDEYRRVGSLALVFNYSFKVASFPIEGK